MRKGHNFDHGKGEVCKGCGKIHVQWNSGKTKETDPRVAINAEHIGDAQRGKKKNYHPWNYGKTKDTDPRLKHYSEIMPTLLKGKIRGWKKGQSETTNSKVAYANRGLHAYNNNPILKSIRVERVRATAHGNHMTFEERSKLFKNMWLEHPEYKDHLGKINKNTSIEVFAQESLVIRNIPFFANKRIEQLVAPDQTLADYKIAIFEDGCYWHGCYRPNCRQGRNNIKNGNYLLRGKQPISLIIERDKFVTSELQKLGYIVIRVSQCEIEKDHDIVWKRLEQILPKEYLELCLERKGKSDLAEWI